jgi:hypothetical protein
LNQGVQLLAAIYLILAILFFYLPAEHGGRITARVTQMLQLPQQLLTVTAASASPQRPFSLARRAPLLNLLEPESASSATAAKAVAT